MNDQEFAFKCRFGREEAPAATSVRKIDVASKHYLKFKESGKLADLKHFFECFDVALQGESDI